MTEDNESTPKAQKEQKAQNQDWNPDRFPTSATPVFRGLTLLFALIGALCFMVYYFSDRSAEEEKSSDHKEAIEDQFLTEDQFSVE